MPHAEIGTGFHTTDCGLNRVCSKDHQCVPVVLDGAAWDGSHAEAPQAQGMDSAPAPGQMDGSPVDSVFLGRCKRRCPVFGRPGRRGRAVGFGHEPVALWLLTPARSMPTFLTLLENLRWRQRLHRQGRSLLRTRPMRFLQDGGIECSGGAPVCSVSHVCVSCALVDAGCPTATPACEADSGRCVECLGDGDCVRDATKSFCQAGLCVGCAGAGASACAGPNHGQSGVHAGRNVRRVRDERRLQSRRETHLRHLSVNVCVPCTSDAQCSGKAGRPGVCMFQQDGHCATDAESVYVGLLRAPVRIRDAAWGRRRRLTAQPRLALAWPRPRASRWSW